MQKKPTAQHSESTVSVNESWRPKISGNRRLIVLVAIFIAIGIVLAVLLLMISPDRQYWRSRLGFGQPVAIRIGSKNISKAEYDEFVNSAPPDQRATGKSLTDLFILNEQHKQVVAKYGAEKGLVLVGGNDIVAYFKETIPKQQQTSYLFAKTYENELLDAVRRAKTGGYYGSYFSFEIDVIRELPGNKTTISRDKYDKQQAYADQKAKYYHEQIKKGQINAQDAIKTIVKDPQLTRETVNNSSLSFFLFNNNQLLNLANTKHVRAIAPSEPWVKTLESLQPGQVSDIQTLKGRLNRSTDAANAVDAEYYFVSLKSKVQANPNLSNELDQLTKKISVRRYVKL